MGKIVQIICGSCGSIRECRTGRGLLHGDLKIVAAEYEESTAKEIRTLAEKTPFAMYDFSFSLAECKHCREIVSVPVLFMKENGKTFSGECPLCGKEAEIVEGAEQMKCPVCDAKNLQVGIIGRWD